MRCIFELPAGISLFFVCFADRVQTKRCVVPTSDRQQRPPGWLVQWPRADALRDTDTRGRGSMLASEDNPTRRCSPTVPATAAGLYLEPGLPRASSAAAASAPRSCLGHSIAWRTSMCLSGCIRNKDVGGAAATGPSPDAPPRTSARGDCPSPDAPSRGTASSSALPQRQQTSGGRASGRQEQKWVGAHICD